MTLTLILLILRFLFTPFVIYGDFVAKWRVPEQASDTARAISVMMQLFSLPLTLYFPHYMVKFAVYTIYIKLFPFLTLNNLKVVFSIKEVGLKVFLLTLFYYLLRLFRVSNLNRTSNVVEEKTLLLRLIHLRREFLCDFYLNFRVRRIVVNGSGIANEREWDFCAYKMSHITCLFFFVNNFK